MNISADAGKELTNRTMDAAPVAFSIVLGAKTDALNGGDSYLAWKHLCDKYDYQNVPSRLKLKKELNISKLENARADPDEWLTKLEDLRVQLASIGKKITDIDLFEYILNNMPEAYENIMTN